MNMYGEDYTKIVKCIMDLLESNKSRSYNGHEVAAHVAATIAYNKSMRVRTIFRALIASGTLHGTVPTSTRRSALGKWKDPVDNESEELAKARKEASDASEAARGAREAANNLVKEAKEELAAVRKELRDKSTILEIHVKAVGKKTRKLKEIFHQRFERIVQLANARMNIFIYGPTGCGKSFICEQVAKVLGLKFAFVSCTMGMSEGVLGGKLLPTGESGRFEYIISEFVKIYETGGLFLLDEIDAADPNVLLIINAALANGRMAVPNRPEKPYAKKHKDFICIGAANTVGKGADRLYSGRNKLDDATLDRFRIGTLHMDYDPLVESQLCPDENLYNHCIKIREAINAHRLERAMSTRFMQDAYKMQTAAEWDHATIDEAFFQGWREDEVSKVQAHMAVPVTA